MQITETDIHPNHQAEDIAFTEAGIDFEIENRKTALREALEIHKLAVAKQEAAQAEADLLTNARQVVSAKSAEVAKKILAEQSSAINEAITAAGTGKQFSGTAVMRSALEIEQQGLMRLLTEIVEERTPAAQDAVVTAECESDSSNGFMLLRYADVRRAQVCKLSLSVAAFEGTTHVRSVSAPDTETARVQLQAENLLQRSKSRLEVLKRDQEQRAIRRRTGSRPNFN